jgi:4-hydroxybenzoate polyprenyltransferase
VQTRFLAFVSLIRLPNLLMLALVQILIVQFYLPAFIPDFQLASWKLCLLILSMCFLAAGGNLINTYFDQQTDLINKKKLYNQYKHLGKRNTILLYLFFSIMGIALGFFLSSDVENYLAFGIYSFVYIVLLGYTKYAKAYFVIGNFLISLLVGLSILLPFILFLDLQHFNLDNPIFQLLSSYIVLSVLINLARELAKDMEDIVGDYASNLHTFPILMGKKRSKFFIQFLVTICIIGLILVYFHFFNGQLFPLLYLFLVLISTGIFIFVKAGKANHKRDFSKLSRLFKIWMSLGLISLAFY